MSKVALVTGGSSGIGRACAAALAGAGYEVYECSRHAPKENMPGVAHLTADVTREEDVKAAVEEIEREAGRLDLLVCCAGFGISGALEFTDPADSHALLETNLFGADNCVRAALAVMRKQQKGRVIFISSVASVVPIPFQGWYSAAKAAMNAYARALAAGGASLRDYGLQRPSRRRQNGFHRRAEKGTRGRRCLRRTHRAFRRRDGTRRKNGNAARANRARRRTLCQRTSRQAVPKRRAAISVFLRAGKIFAGGAICARIVERVYAK